MTADDPDEELRRWRTDVAVASSDRTGSREAAQGQEEPNDRPLSNASSISSQSRLQIEALNRQLQAAEKREREAVERVH